MAFGQRIAPAIARGIQVHRQVFRGQTWYVFQDPFGHQFYRVLPAAYRFLVRLGEGRTVDEVWEGALERDGDDAPGQGEVVHLLGQMYRANLLQGNLPGDSAQLFERQRKRKQRELRSKLMSLMFLRIPLWNPDQLLRVTLPMVGWLMGWFGWLIWVGMGIWAGKALAENWGAFQVQTQNLLSQSNLIWLYAGLVLTKVLHEFGHGYACRRYGGQVPVVGMMLLLFVPFPYVDASASWSFPRAWQRIHVASAGMILEVFVAFIALLVWAHTDGGALHNLAYNMVFVASVATVVFNLNPLLRFDGYYILSDLTGFPNLHKQAQGQAKYLLERYLFGLKSAYPPVRKRGEQVFLFGFFVASMIYRVLLFTGIIWLVADQYLVVGFLLAMVGVVTWLIMPVFKAYKHVFRAPGLARVRRRAVMTSLMVPVALIVALGMIPAHHHLRARGVVRAHQYSDVHAEVNGQLMEVLISSGQRVEAGQPLLRLENVELRSELAAERHRRSEAAIRARRVGQEDLARLPYLQKWSRSIDLRIQDLEQSEDELMVLAPHPGVWIAPNVHELKGVWLQRGLALGRVIHEERYDFSAIVTQAQSHFLFEQGALVEGGNPEVRLRGQAACVLKAQGLEVLPAETQELPSSALGMLGGGEIEVEMGPEGQGRRSKEPVFELRAELLPSEGEIVFQHDLSGVMRIRLRDEPLLGQWLRQGRQAFQRRFRL